MSIALTVDSVLKTNMFCLWNLFMHWLRPVGVFCTISVTHDYSDNRCQQPYYQHLLSMEYCHSCTSSRLYCLMTEAGMWEQLARNRHWQCSGWDLNPWPLDHESDVVPLSDRLFVACEFVVEMNCSLWHNGTTDLKPLIINNTYVA